MRNRILFLLVTFQRYVTFLYPYFLGLEVVLFIAALVHSSGPRIVRCLHKKTA